MKPRLLFLIRTLLIALGWLISSSQQLHGAMQYEWITFAGKANTHGSANGQGAAARFYNPFGIGVDALGNVHVADWGNCTVRKITPTGQVSLLAGSPGKAGSADGFGASARFGARVPVGASIRNIGPRGIAVSPAGIVYVTDQNQTVRKITGGGQVLTIAGRANTVGSPFHSVTGVAADASGNVYVSDEGAHFLGKINSVGAYTHLCGLTGISGWADGTGTTARFSRPMGLCFTNGSVLVADMSNSLIRAVTPTGTVSHFAGLGLKGSDDGPKDPMFPVGAMFHDPYAVAADAAGNVFLADGYNQMIRKISAGQVTTIGGKPRTPGTANGIGAAARFNSPHGIAVDAFGHVYVADFFNHTIRRGTLVDELAVSLTGGTSLTSGVSTVDMGKSKVGTPVRRTVVLKNRGTGVLSIVSATFTGGNGDFFVTGAIDPDIPEGGSTSFHVEYHPSSAGPGTNTLEIRTTTTLQPTFTIQFHGEGMETPAITSPPLSQLETTGATINLSAMTTGGALSHQWLRNKKPVAGALTPLHTFSASKATVGLYALKSSNGEGSITSPEAAIGCVNTTDKNVLVAEGSSLTLSLDAEGPGLQFEWRREGVPMTDGTNPAHPAGTISGSRSRTLRLTKAALDDGVEYTCLVTMPDPQQPSTPLTRLSGKHIVKTVHLPVMNAYVPAVWQVGKEVTDSVTALNEPLSYKATGLPTGVTLSAAGQFSGRPKVTLTTPKVFPLVITATNLRGTSLPLRVNVTVQPMPSGITGSYTGLIPPSEIWNGKLGGTISPIISASGVITGSIRLGAFSHGLLGQILVPTVGEPTASFNAGGLDITFTVDVSNGGLKLGLIDDGTHAVAFHAWADLWKTPAPSPARDSLNRFRGYYTFALKADTGQPTLPQGASYGSFTVGNDGKAKITGRLADNTPFTCSTFCGPGGEILLFQTAYTYRGSIAGKLVINPGTVGFTPPYGDNTLGGSSQWQRPSIAGRDYPAGFLRYTLTAAGGRYLPPVAPRLALNVLDDLTHDNATLTFDHADFLAPLPNIDFRLKANSRFVSPASITNPRNTDLTLDAVKGNFQGSFILTDPNPIVGTAKRPASFQGIIIRDTDNVLRGHGFVLLANQPQNPDDTVTSTPRQSGHVELSSLP